MLVPLLQPFTLKVAVASGLDYAMPLLDAVRNGTNTYNFLEASWAQRGHSVGGHRVVMLCNRLLVVCKPVKVQGLLDLLRPHSKAAPWHLAATCNAGGGLGCYSCHRLVPCRCR